MQKRMKWLALALAAAMMVTSFAACGGSGKSTQETTTPAAETAAEDETPEKEAADDAAADTQEAPADETADEDIPTDTFTYIISNGEDARFYDSYNESPAYLYWASKPVEVDGEKRYLNLEFWEPPVGSESDYTNNLIATGEYADIVNTAYSSMKAPELYDQGVAIDLTEYVEKYMPNYMQWIEDHDYYDYVTNLVDGERKFIQLYDVCDVPGEMWGGYEYRRDWIVKYGKNPETGEAFSGEWKEDEDGVRYWEDDVVFPSGNNEPIYISDWEWMLDIFATALKEQGITDGYPMSIPYQGAQLTGDFITAFGGGALWYINEDGECVFGITEDHTKAYLECMANWYSKGWIDPYFDEHTNDMFFSIDSASVYSGKVGAFYGLTSQLEDAMDTGAGDASDGAVVFGAKQPINDLYGTADDQNKEPTNYYGGDLVNVSVIVTNKAEDKNLPTFFAKLDELYTADGGMLRNYGLSKEMQEEFQSEFYIEWGLEDGAWEKVTDENGDYMYVLNPAVNEEDGLGSACTMMRVLAQTTNAHLDKGYSKSKAPSVANWTYYASSGNVPSAVSAQLTPDQAQEASAMQNNVMTYISQELPGFIRGEKNLEGDWDSFVSGMDDYDPYTYCDWINAIIGE